MFIQIGLALSAHSHARAQQSPAPTPALQMAAFSRDRVVFDSGAARGADAADIPVSGTTDAPDGTQIEARVVAAAGGAQIHPWTAVATASGGAWSGAYPGVPRNTGWLQIEARVQGSASTVSAGPRFGVGHVWALFEQSNGNRSFDPAFSGTVPDPVTDGEAVQILQVDRSADTASVVHVSDATPHSAATVAFANTFAAARPGEKLALVVHTQPGTAPTDMVSDATGARDWSDEVTLNAFATADGQQVGLVFTPWMEWNGSAGNVDLFAQVLTGHDLSGNPVAQGSMVGGFPLDNRLGVLPGDTPWGGEFYDWAVTRFAYVGPHERGKPAGNAATLYDAGASYAAGAIVYADANAPDAWVSRNGGNSGNPLPAAGNSSGHWLYQPKTAETYGTAGDVAFQGYIDAIRALPDNPNFAFILPATGFEHFGLATGEADGSHWWTDFSHKSRDDKAGLERLASFYAISALQAAGLITLPAPAFDHVAWDPAGAHVDYGISGRDITTERRLQALPVIPAVDNMGTALPHRTEVMGFAINGQPAGNAQIAPGAGPLGEDVVRVFPNAGVFTYADTVEYGLGQQPGFVQYPDDYLDRYWLNLPVVDLGQPRLAALPVQTRSAGSLGNLLPAPAQFSTVYDGTDAGSGPYFSGNAASLTYGSGVTSLRAEWVGQFSDLSRNMYLLASGGSTVTLELMRGGTLRSGGSNSGIPTVQATSDLLTGVTYTITMVLNVAAGTFTVDVDDGSGPARQIDATLSSPPAGIASNRYPVFLRRNDGLPGSQVVGTFSAIRMWRNDPTGAGTPWIEIAGDSAAVNANSLKLGSDTP